MENTPLQPIGTTASDRARRMNQDPVVIWLTGLSGAGKSTIADRLDQRLHRAGYGTFVLDGDNLRRGLNSDLGFSETDRTENVRRVGHVAALMADAGLIVIVSLISPYRHDREGASQTVGKARFIEVFVDAPLETCAARDPKGMYAKARAGLIRSFTGIASDYEKPERPDIHLRTDQSDPDTSVASLITALEKRAIIRPIREQPSSVLDLPPSLPV